MKASSVFYRTSGKNSLYDQNFTSHQSFDRPASFGSW